MGVNGKGLRKTVNDLLHNPVRIFYCIQVRKNQRKLIASNRATVSTFLSTALKRSAAALRRRSPTP
jgi:hypothetical protein